MKSEKRLIDAEAIARKLKNANCAECNIVRQIQCSACWVNDVLELLDSDSVDAVEVVRCKDCKHWKHFEHLGCTDFVKVCGLANYMIGAKGYCLYGERKDNEDSRNPSV